MKMETWPHADAPISEWLRPVSAKLRNKREPLSCSTVDKSDGQSERTKRRQFARRKRRENGGD